MAIRYPRYPWTGCRKAWKKQSSSHTKKIPAVPLEDPTPKWFTLLVSAACWDETIQMLVLKETEQPGLHWYNNRIFNPPWILGLQLPGSYQFPTVDTKISDNSCQVSRCNLNETMDDVYKESVAYLHNIINTQSAKEGENFRRCCERMANCGSRPAAVKQWANTNPSPIMRDDKWWHFRRLWQMLPERCSLRHDLYRIYKR